MQVNKSSRESAVSPGNSQQTVLSRILGLKSPFLQRLVIIQGLVIGYWSFVRVAGSRAYPYLIAHANNLGTARTTILAAAFMIAGEVLALLLQVLYRQKVMQSSKRTMLIMMLWPILALLMGGIILLQPVLPTLSVYAYQGFHILCYAIFPNFLTNLVMRYGDTLSVQYITNEAKGTTKTPVQVLSLMHTIRFAIVGILQTLLLVLHYSEFPLFSFDIFRFYSAVPMSYYSTGLTWRVWGTLLQRGGMVLLPLDKLIHTICNAGIIGLWLSAYVLPYGRYYDSLEQEKATLKATSRGGHPGTAIAEALRGLFYQRRTEAALAVAYVFLGYLSPTILNTLLQMLAVIKIRGSETPPWWSRIGSVLHRIPHFGFQSESLSAELWAFKQRGTSSAALYRMAAEGTIMASWSVFTRLLFGAANHLGISDRGLVSTISALYYPILQIILLWRASRFGEQGLQEIMEDATRILKLTIRFSFTLLCIREPIHSTLRELYEVCDPVILMVCRCIVPLGTRGGHGGTPLLWSLYSITLLTTHATYGWYRTVASHYPRQWLTLAHLYKP